MRTYGNLVAIAFCLLLANILPQAAVVADDVGQHNDVSIPTPIDVSELLKIEQAVLPPPLVPGPNAHEDLPAYFVAANPELQDRLERIRSLYEQGQVRPFHAITLVAGDAGIGKTFLKQQVFSKSYAPDAVFKCDIRKQYERWRQEGIVAWKPDLFCGDEVINSLLSIEDPQDQSVQQLLAGEPASFYVIDSLDELHPDDYVRTLEQIEEFAFHQDRDFVHVVVFGRPFAFVQYWRSIRAQKAGRDISLFILQPPKFRTTGDLVVSSWNYDTWKYDVRWSLRDGRTGPLTLTDYVDWSSVNFQCTGRFLNVCCKAHHEINAKVRDALLLYAQQYRILGPPLCNLAGNSIIREIVAQRTMRNLPYDEREVMASYFNAWLERDHESDGRPSYAHPEHVDLYLKLLEQVAIKYLVEGRVDEEGCFAVKDDDQMVVMHNGREMSFPVTRILDRSGMKHLDPRPRGTLNYRFEPIWLHRYLVERYNERMRPRR